MVRQYDNLYAGLVSFENLLLAYNKAARGKRANAVVLNFELNQGRYLLARQRRMGDGATMASQRNLFHVACVFAIAKGTPAK